MQPHVILGDEAFALHENLMKPFPRNQSLIDRTKAIYNYRHSRARRVSENAFGILAAYFRLFFQPIALKPDTIDLAVTSACILHNILRDSKIPAPQQQNCDDDLPLPQNNLTPLRRSNTGRNSKNAFAVRHQFSLYFRGTGAVPWQNNAIRTQ